MRQSTIVIISCGVLALFGGTAFGVFLASRNLDTESSISPTPATSSTTTTTKTSPPPLPVVTKSTTSTLTFIADVGTRAENASNAGVRFQSSTLQLLYESQAQATKGKHPVEESTEASDWLTFAPTTTETDQDTFRAHHLPDGTWRTYGVDTTVGIEGSCLQSRSSTDGVTYTPDEGCRYTLQDADNGKMGVYELFNTSTGDVVLLYIGDMMGMNNVRRAVSTDGGWTFTFDHDDVLGDESAGGGSGSYVDEKVVSLGNEAFYLVAMKSGSIYGFLSSDDGATFVNEGAILVPSDYGLTNGSLHDPQIIALPDGRYRIFVTLFDRDTGESSIVSATTL